MQDTECRIQDNGWRVEGGLKVEGCKLRVARFQGSKICPRMQDVWDGVGTDATGRGVVNILTADKLILSPKLYATFLLWLLSELFEQLPEVGDPRGRGSGMSHQHVHKGFMNKNGLYGGMNKKQD